MALVIWVGAGWLSVIGYCIWEKVWLDRRWPWVEEHQYDFRRWEMWVIFTILGVFSVLFVLLMAREMIRMESAEHVAARMKKRNETSGKRR